MLLESPYGGRTEPRIREHFDRLVDRISAYEVRALAEGDGFTEKKYEAGVDRRAAGRYRRRSGTPPAPPELKDAVQSDLETANHDIPIPLNQRVLAYIELFQGRLHDFIEEGMKRGSKYLPMIQSVFRAEGLPLDLAYVPLVESAFKPNALSRAKAKGVWQFMAGTALGKRPAPRLVHRRAVGSRKGHGGGGEVSAHAQQDVRRRLAPRAGLLQRRPGPDAARDEAGGGVDDFWKLAAKPKLLPRETREYVPMILAAIVIARNPAQYGFDFEPETPAEYRKGHAARARSTCGASPSGPTRPSTRSRRSIPSCGAGRRRSRTRSTS